MEECFRKTKDRLFIVELKDRAMNIIFLLYVKIESKSNVFGIRESLGEERGYFLSLSYGQVVELRPRPTWFMIVNKHYKENKHSSSTHHLV